MSVACRVFESKLCEITQKYKKGKHDGIDLTNKNHTFGWITAHSDGTVVAVVNDCNKNTYKTGPAIYGNYVKIKHKGGYYTLYAHGKYKSVKVKKGDTVKQGQVIMYMGNTGYSNGGHLHWEVRTMNDKKMDPTKYLNANLPDNNPSPVPDDYKIGDVVTISRVYRSSDSTEGLHPLIKKGTITRIIKGAKNPYLLDNGNIGWVNKNCITGKVTDDGFKVGDVVVPTKLVDVNGTKLVQYDKEYTIKAIHGNSALLYAKRDGKYYLWAVLPFSNIKKVGK